MPPGTRHGKRGPAKSPRSGPKSPQAKRKRRPTAKPKLRLAAIKAMIQSFLKDARKHVEAEEDGMDRLIRALRRPKSKPKKKAA